ncbi:MAG: hypothetical protein WBF77_00125 [Sulfurimonadaceae bacterium]
MVFRALLLMLSLLVLSACVSKSSSSADTASLENDKKHKIESEELRLLMRELNMVVYDRQKSELDRDDIRRRYVLNLADVVKELATKIEHISPDELGKELAEKERELYTRYAQELYQNGEEIHAVAQKYEMEKLESSMAKMQQTCESCHALLRD